MWKLQSQPSKLYISLRPELYTLIKSIKKTQKGNKKRDEEEEKDMEETQGEK